MKTKTILTIKRTENGILVYDDKAKDRMDFFPLNKEGVERFLDFMESMGVNNPKQYLE